MPASIADSSQNSSPQTLPMASLVSGATPLYFPLEAAPDPVMMEATWVPWPTVSSVLLPPVKSWLVVILPAKSGWVASMPVSRIAVVVPCPVSPAAHAVGAPICGTLSFRSTLRCRPARSC